MNKNKVLINLGLCFSLLFCMAFACGDEKGDAGGGGEPTTRTTTREASNDEGAAMTTQAGVGAKYGAHDPRTCPDTKSPTKGALSDAQARKYIICAREGVGGGEGNLTLIEDLKVKVGGGVPYNPKTFPYSDIDTEALVYPYRSSYKQYYCVEVSEGRRNKGQNCFLYVEPKVDGECYRTSFGDWKCTRPIGSLANPVDYEASPPQ